MAGGLTVYAFQMAPPAPFPLAGRSLGRTTARPSLCTSTLSPTKMLSRSATRREAGWPRPTMTGNSCKCIPWVSSLSTQFGQYVAELIDVHTVRMRHETTKITSTNEVRVTTYISFQRLPRAPYGSG